MGTITGLVYDPVDHEVVVTVTGPSGARMVVATDQDGQDVLNKPLVYTGPPTGTVVDEYPVAGTITYRLFESPTDDDAGLVQVDTDTITVDPGSVVIKTPGPPITQRRPPVELLTLSGWQRRGRNWYGNVIGEGVAVSVSDTTLSGKEVRMTLRPLTATQLEDYSQVFFRGNPFFLTGCRDGVARGLSGWLMIDTIRDRQTVAGGRLELDAFQVFPSGFYKRLGPG